MSDSFTKLFADIVTSSIWSEDDKTRLVWITMLALSNSKGFVPASIPGLANAARVSIDDCVKAVARLESPDPYSRTKDNEGRRIQPSDGGWMILNYKKHRERGKDDRRDYMKRLMWGRRHPGVPYPESVSTPANSPITEAHCSASASASSSSSSESEALNSEKSISIKASESEPPTPSVPESRRMPQASRSTPQGAIVPQQGGVIAPPDKAGAAASGAGSGGTPPKTTWMTFYIEAWRRKAGADMVVSHAVKPLKKAEQDHSTQTVHLAFAAYLKDTPVKFLSVPRFCEHIGAWLPTPPPTTGYVTDDKEWK